MEWAEFQQVRCITCWRRKLAGSGHARRCVIRVRRQINVHSATAFLARRGVGAAPQTKCFRRSPLFASSRGQRYYRPHQPREPDRSRIPCRAVSVAKRCCTEGFRFVRHTERQRWSHGKGHVCELQAFECASQTIGAVHHASAEWRRSVHCGSERSLHRRSHAPSRHSWLRVWAGQCQGLGSEGDSATRCSIRPGTKLRAHPSQQPGRHGRCAAAVSCGSRRGLARPDRNGAFLDHTA